MNTLQNLSAPLGRFLLSLVFLLAGIQKIGAYAGTQAYMESMGVPGILLPLVIALEILSPLAIMVGWHARINAFLLAGFSILAGILFHGGSDDPMQTILLMKNLGLAGGLLLVVALGAGPYSLESRRSS